MRFEQELRIERSPADVFAYLTDARNLPRWQRTVESCAAPQRAEVGSTFSEVRVAAGRRTRTTLEVAELEPDRLFVIRTLDGPVRATVRHVLEPDGEGTWLHVTAEASFEELPRLVRPLVRRQVEGELSRDFARLKALLEANGE